MNRIKNVTNKRLEITVSDFYQKEHKFFCELSKEDEVELREFLMEKVDIEPAELLKYLQTSDNLQMCSVGHHLRQDVAKCLSDEYEYDQDYVKKVMFSMRAYTPNMNWKEKNEWESTKNRMRYRMKEEHNMVPVFGGLTYYQYSFGSDIFCYIRDYNLFEITNYKIA